MDTQDVKVKELRESGIKFPVDSRTRRPYRIWRGTFAVATCVTLVYVNNITNSPVTFRLADKTGTPIIWIGGNADYTVPANSNVAFPLGGVLFTSGITAIAGTGSAINLQVNGLQ
jgi:hypothetical protein